MPSKHHDSAAKSEPLAIDSRRQRKQLSSMRLIANTAWNMFEQEGFEAVTMESIATRADVAKATLYKYFDSKEALLDFQLRQTMAEQRDSIKTHLLDLNNLRARLNYLFQIEADFLESKKNYMRPLLHYRMRQMRNDDQVHNKSQFVEALVIIFKMAQAAGELRSDLSAEALANYLNFLRSADLFEWLNRADGQLDQLHHRMLDLFLNGAGITSASTQGAQS